MVVVFIDSINYLTNNINNAVQLFFRNNLYDRQDSFCPIRKKNVSWNWYLKPCTRVIHVKCSNTRYRIARYSNTKCSNSRCSSTRYSITICSIKRYSITSCSITRYGIKRYSITRCSITKWGITRCSIVRYSIIIIIKTQVPVTWV